MRKTITKLSFEMVRSANTISYFYDQLAKGVLVGSKCQKCGTVYVPPRALCTKCYTRNPRSIRLSGKGRIVTFTIVHVAPPELESLAPYAVAVVSLREGPPLLGILKDAKRPDDITIGGEVAVDFDSTPKVTPGTVRIVFKPCSRSA